MIPISPPDSNILPAKQRNNALSSFDNNPTGTAIFKQDVVEDMKELRNAHFELKIILESNSAEIVYNRTIQTVAMTILVVSIHQH